MSSARQFLVPRPPFSLSIEVRGEISAILEAATRDPETTLIDYDRVPKWQMLAYLTDAHDVMFHGTGNPEIAEFIPRPCNDMNPFGAQKAVFASSDGIWAMFYAILDRSVKPFGMHNACLRLLDDEERESEPYYFLSITRARLEERRFKDGFVYLLPKATFVRDPMSEEAGLRFTPAHWASPEAVKPIAIIPIKVSDFPLLGDIRGHEHDVLGKRIEENPHGFPWVDEQYLGGK